MSSEKLAGQVEEDDSSNLARMKTIQMMARRMSRASPAAVQSGMEIAGEFADNNTETSRLYLTNVCFYSTLNFLSVDFLSFCCHKMREHWIKSPTSSMTSEIRTRGDAFARRPWSRSTKQKQRKSMDRKLLVASLWLCQWSLNTTWTRIDRLNLQKVAHRGNSLQKSSK